MFWKVFFLFTLDYLWTFPRTLYAFTALDKNDYHLLLCVAHP